ncbi:MAG TPA: hypothetical protein VLL49_01435 [Anaerolineales bacterium]|nr:hypothetical protein [Anaerolineales bacterium]
MSIPTLYRLGALAGVLSGACIIIGRLLAGLPDTQPAEVFDVLSPFFALFLAVSLYLGQRRESGAFGAVAFIVLFTGLVALVCLDYYGAFIRLYLPPAIIEQVEQGPSSGVFVGSLLTFLAGEMLFGISVIRAGIYSRAAAVLFMLGLVAVVLHPTGLLPEWVIDLGAAAAGTGLIVWSRDLHRLARTRAHAR